VKILNILIFSILITTNVYAGGVYGNLYNKSDLASQSGEGEFEAEQKIKKLNAKREQIQRSEQAEERRTTDKEFDEAQRRSRR
jgi:hypothetical protein